MFPLTAELNPSDYYVLAGNRKGVWKLLGFRFEHSGINKITITGRPALNESLRHSARCLRYCLKIIKTLRKLPVSGAKEKVASAMAGASAIPYGKILTKDEMEDLFDTLFACQVAKLFSKRKTCD